MTMNNVDEFNAKLNEFIRELVPSQVKKVVTAVGLEALNRVVKRTPVDTGRARGNWQVGVNSRPTGSLKREDKSGSKTIAAGATRIRVASPYCTIYIVNNLDYVRVLEYGLFVPPNPGPTRDTRRGRKGRILVRDGYSVQAPKGMVGLTLADLKAMFR